MLTVVFLLEEQSAEEMLKGIWPAIEKTLPTKDISIEFKIFEGKQDLNKRVEKILRNWLKPNSIFIIMRDQDSGDCKKIKKELLDKCSCKNGYCLIRIACRELESYYLGNLEAVEIGYNITPGHLSSRQQSKKFRDPDQLNNAADELKKLTDKRYQKVLGSRLISPHLSISQNCSKSFMALVTGIQKIIRHHLGKL